MADHPNEIPILGLGSSQNRSALHVSGKRSNLHLSFQNEKKAAEPPVNKIEFTPEIPSNMSLKLNSPGPKAKPAIIHTQRSLRWSPSNDHSESPPPPLPPKLKLKQGNSDSFHQLSLSSEYAQPRPSIPCANDNVLKIPVEKSNQGREGLSLNLSTGGCGEAGSRSSRWVSSCELTSSITKGLKPCASKIVNADVDLSFKDQSMRDQKKKQLVLHLPPSGASHHAHLHPHHYHHNHHHHHRHLHHETRSHRRERLSRGIYSNIQLSGKLNISPDVQVDFTADDLHDLGEIGRGGFGTVNKMVHRKTNTIMAVKRIRLTVDENEQKQLRDLEVAMWSNDCPFIVQFYGATLKEGDCWICMELMDTSLDKFYKFVYEKLQDCIPESILGKITLATLTALNYLKEKLKLIHRDVKPSNILLDRRGNLKLCDFGISGHLVDSIAKTRDAGCRPYMAPERIDPAQARGYDVRSDVWSLGITLMELATGSFPYPKWNSVFEQLTQVVQGEPPRLNLTENGNTFTEDFVNFVNTCLTKEESARPKYKQLLDHSFVLKSREDTINVAQYVSRVLDKMENNEKFMYTYNSYNY